MQSLNALAARLRSLGHPVSIRTALGGGWGGECLRNLRHSFLVCTVSGELLLALLSLTRWAFARFLTPQLCCQKLVCLLILLSLQQHRMRYFLCLCQSSVCPNILNTAFLLSVHLALDTLPNKARWPAATGKDGPATYIIDPAFREQFNIAHPTPRYEQILAAIPATFVGTEERLVALVRALCHEIQGVFLEQNSTLPPWRDVAAQLSKWRPRRSTDCPITQQDESSKDMSHRLNLTARTASAADVLQSQTVLEGESGIVLKPAGLSRTSAPIPLPPALAAGSAGDGSSKPELVAGSSNKNLYQRVAGPMQQFVTRSYTHSGLLMTGL